MTVMEEPSVTPIKSVHLNAPKSEKQHPAQADGTANTLAPPDSEKVEKTCLSTISKIMIGLYIIYRLLMICQYRNTK